MLEVAIAVPLLISLALGVAEYGYFIYAKCVFQEAAQIGARIAIQDSATDTAVRSEITTRLTQEGFQSMGYTVTTTPTSVATIATGTNVTVTITCPWSASGVRVLPESLGGINETRPVTGTSTMCRE